MSEGDTEFVCIPKIVGRLGHQVVSNVQIGGCSQDWDQTFEFRVLPYVKTAALKHPDKILIVVDREARSECCPELARKAAKIIAVGLKAANLTAQVSIVVSDRNFEVIVMSDYELVDRMEILSSPVSIKFGAALDGKNPKSLVGKALKPGKKYHKVRHGGACDLSGRCTLCNHPKKPS